MLSYMSAFLVNLLLASVLIFLAMSGPGKKTRGRQKIEMKKIESEYDKLVTFSKRRSGIYKKASELAALCGVEITILVFSPAGKPFTFGHPSVESVTNRFLNISPPLNINNHPVMEAFLKARLEQLTLEFNEVTSELAAEKERAKKLDQMNKGKEIDRGWWEAPIDQLNQQELIDLYSKFADFRSILLNKMNEKIAGGADEDGAISPLLSPMDPSQQTYPFAPIVNDETFPATFPPGFEFGPSGLY